MDKDTKAQMAQRGHGTVKNVVHTATLLYAGWEMDNFGWIVEFTDSTRKALTTSHGGVYPWDRAEAEKKLAETEASAASIRQALAMWPTN